MTLDSDATTVATSSAADQSVLDREAGLHRSLTSGQLSMIAIGGAIGTGLFLGSALAIKLAGPGVILSYAAGAVITLLLMWALAEMTVAHPVAGSFGVHAEIYLHPWAGFTMRYSYWLAQVVAIVDDPAIEVRYSGQSTRPPGIPTQLDSALFAAVTAAVSSVYQVPTIPMLLTAATDKAQLRARGMQCVGIGSAIDVEDQVKGFGMHSDQERILESELYRFVRFNWEIVNALARAR